MQITYDHTIFGLQEYGGISRYFSELIPRIARNPEVRVYAYQGIHINRYSLAVQGSRPAKQWGLRRPRLRGTGRMMCRLNDFVFDHFVAPREPLAICHSTYYRTGVARLRCKVVVTVYDCIDELLGRDPGREARMGKAACIRRADHLIAISECTKRDLIAVYGVPEDRVTVVPLASSLLPAHPSSTSNERVFLRELGIRRPFLLYVGHTRRGYKNFAVLLKAYETTLLEEMALVAFGGPPFSGDELAPIQRIRQQGGVVLHLRGPDNLLSVLYRNASCFVYPSLYEGFGIPVLEAMEHDCPVVAAMAGAIPEVAGDAACLFDPQSPRSLASALHRVLRSPAQAQALVERGKRQVREFSWDRTANETLDVYQSVISN